MAAEDSDAQFVGERTTPLLLTSGARFHWDGMRAVSRERGLQYVSAHGMRFAGPTQWPPATGRRTPPPVTTSPPCLLPAPPLHAIDCDMEAACVTFSLDPGLLLATVHFVQLRALFETIVLELDVHMDLVAARITVLGGMVQGTVRTAATQSTLPEYPGDLVTGDAHVLAVAERVASYATAIWTAIEHAANVEDAATTNVYTDISRGIEARLSLLDTYLHQ